MSGTGRVWLVGAGPGDPGLITRKGAACLRRADLVLYDALVHPRVVAIARHAQRFFVGKRAGRHQLSQAEIHTVMIRAAQRGRRVVRLKGGDPFVFGRGGEEALAVAAAGIPCEVVPGVTSAVAAPAMAGIPVTQRGVAAGVLVLSGHDEAAFTNALAAVQPSAVTLVVLMGHARRAGLAAALIGRGWQPMTPAAIVRDGTLPEQHVWRGTLAQLAAPTAETTSEGIGPAMLVIGEVAALDVLDARRTLPNPATATDVDAVAAAASLRAGRTRPAVT
jgi:uroporphyrin-III C-methyltransferase/precorrin-2 dehydrogenase/sirohydrochlorin ferrochelatase